MRSSRIEPKACRAVSLWHASRPVCIASLQLLICSFVLLFSIVNNHHRIILSFFPDHVIFVFADLRIFA
jgi:hypothetical protein